MSAKKTKLIHENLREVDILHDAPIIAKDCREGSYYLSSLKNLFSVHVYLEGEFDERYYKETLSRIEKLEENFKALDQLASVAIKLRTNLQRYLRDYGI